MAVRYTVSFPEPHTHYAEIEAVFPTDGREQTELFMAVWTPGAYLVREFARHVEGVAAASDDGQALAVGKVAKNRWRVEHGGVKEVHFTYRVYCREMSRR